MDDSEKEFNKLNAIFMEFHDQYKDVIADCDKDAFEILYDMHHNTSDHILKTLFKQMYDEFCEILKTCSTELFDDLQKIVKQL